jgi:hypothetical protein
VGHANVRTTLDVYVHLFPDDDATVDDSRHDRARGVGDTEAQGEQRSGATALSRLCGDPTDLDVFWQAFEMLRPKAFEMKARAR